MGVDRMVSKINLNEKFSLFREHWRPKIIADFNGQELKIVTLEKGMQCRAHGECDDG